MTIINARKVMLAEAVQLLKSTRLLEGIRSELYERLIQEGVFIRLEKKQAIFHQGEEANFWYLVLNGQVNTLRYGRNGEELIYQHRMRGQLLATLVMFMPEGRYPVHAWASMPSLVCRWPRRILHQFCLTQPDIGIRLLSSAGELLQQSMDNIESFSLCTLEQRVARYLLKVSKTQGRHITFSVTQRLLAHQLGIRTETLNRLLAQWKKKGVIHGMGNNLYLNNMDFLINTSGET
ncbi:Crp/Fnr family transcriptional regulator [Salmonella enterica]|nr:Crp/Fnr family transcriptional regulator [Salmonella enterica]EKC7222102.1 Crp/Fnr family transcriptional regulator [Salmonella enterica]EKJ5694340.1 Crp/Fnr family transcriptional regulator [Salmonella enterica]